MLKQLNTSLRHLKIYIPTPGQLAKRSFVSVGDKVPVNFHKEGKDPVIKKDDHYPPWLKELTKKNLSKAELMKIGETEGYESLEIEDLQRLKRLITLETIKENNESASTGL
mmetsp:Transcript_27462/g.27687  ORF Transcript_27462/g.27687 Transcript_27462/m.27687 type:complete len:111 (-) Transcript_27462:70-402(-)